MPKISSFRDLDVYQLGLREAKRVFVMTREFPREERYSLTDQIRRSSRAVNASRRQFPSHGDRQAFEEFLKQGVFERISVEYRGQLHAVYHIFYKWFRCQLVHEGGLPIDIEFMRDSEPGTVAIRAGGAPEYILRISHGWFHELIHAVTRAPVNAALFDDARAGAD